jgi:hypothetical protein
MKLREAPLRMTIFVRNDSLTGWEPGVVAHFLRLAAVSWKNVRETALALTLPFGYAMLRG